MTEIKEKTHADETAGWQFYTVFIPKSICSESGSIGVDRSQPPHTIPLSIPSLPAIHTSHPSIYYYYDGSTLPLQTHILSFMLFVGRYASPATPRLTPSHSVSVPIAVHDASMSVLNVYLYRHYNSIRYRMCISSRTNCQVWPT